MLYNWTLRNYEQILNSNSDLDICLSGGIARIHFPRYNLRDSAAPGGVLQESGLAKDLDILCVLLYDDCSRLCLLKMLLRQELKRDGDDTTGLVCGSRHQSTLCLGRPDLQEGTRGSGEG
ncbi:unnamed protein product [Allacma fusca]|uniref:Uncharacterized protein n=1 Tax=Allacma fusca TaxID=39272 RepID=A0A8J2L5Q4_9HEXA|nr:unnamed protein product [Allacma fusca]